MPILCLLDSLGDNSLCIQADALLTIALLIVGLPMVSCHLVLIRRTGGLYFPDPVPDRLSSTTKSIYLAINIGINTLCWN